MFNKNREDVKTNENQSNEQVIENPKEIRIVGNIARVYVQGNELEQNIVFNPKDVPKKKNKSYIIVPVKDKNSQVEFVKVPIYKLNKKPHANATGSVNSKKLNRDQETTTEELTLWSAPKQELFDDGPKQETQLVIIDDKANTPKKEISIDQTEKEEKVEEKEPVVEKEDKVEKEEEVEQSPIRASVQSTPNENFSQAANARRSIVPQEEQDPKKKKEEKEKDKKKDKKKEKENSKKKDKKGKVKDEPPDSPKDSSENQPSRILSYLVTVKDKKKK